MNTQQIVPAMTGECINVDRTNFLAGEQPNETNFLKLLTDLLTSGAEGEETLIALLNNKGNTNEEPVTIDSLIDNLNFRVNGESTLGAKNNFIIGESDIKDLLEDIKSLSDNATDITNENLSQYISDINQENGFLQMRAMQSLNQLAQNSNISSTISGMISNLSLDGDNKEVINALKFLQQFTESDGSLNTSKLVKALEGNKSDGSELMNNMNLSNGGFTESTSKVPIKEVNIFKSNDIVDVVIENFKNLRLPGRCEMRIKLNPQELGEITIKLVLEKGQISGVISADKKETLALLQSNLQNLQEQFKESGTNLHHITVNLSKDDNGEEARRGYNREDNKKEENEFEDIFEDIFEENNLIDDII